MEQTDITNMSLTQLKAIAYDLSRQMSFLQTDLNLVNKRIMSEEKVVPQEEMVEETTEEVVEEEVVEAVTPEEETGEEGEVTPETTEAE